MPFTSRSAASLPWLLPMGSRPALLFTVPLLLLAAPALAQEQEGGEPVFNLPRTTQPADPSRQGPELDVFRGAPVTPPPVTTPVITPPPVVTPAPVQPQTPVTAEPPRPAAPAPRPAPAQPAPQPESSSPAPAAPMPEAAPAPAPQAAPSPAPAAPAAEPPLSAPAEATPWPWIAGGIALLAAVLAAAWLFFRRRATDETLEQEPFVEEQDAPPPPPAPRPAPKAPAAPAPEPVPAPAPAAVPPPASTTTDRPWIDLMLEVRGARLSLMGVTIGYSLTLHNRGTRGAEDILIRTLIANASTSQQALLQQFFAGSIGLPAHSAVSIAPGESQSLTGELRLLPDQITPVQMGDRALLIPLIAFDAQYRWADEPSGGSGRTGRAFIIGQEKSPPADRLAPFRLDQGPRQFRAPGSRATALELAS